jgi:2-keto-4-pentenoate hydratase/2-oxohepta-3-ene-1,7-dioic acid hydratase in catechol pathway
VSGAFEELSVDPEVECGVGLAPGHLQLKPAGVGTGRGEFLNAGDVVRIEIERIGTLSNRIV